MLGCLSLYCFMVFGPPSLALDPARGAGPAATAVSVQGYGLGTACRSWTDGCVVCTRPASGQAACSTPGIACTPGPIACTIP